MKICSIFQTASIIEHNAKSSTNKNQKCSQSHTERTVVDKSATHASHIFDKARKNFDKIRIYVK